jgi:hypothetical protein
MIRRNSPTEGATLSVNVAPQRGDVDAFLRELRKNPEGFVAGVRSRFPDAVLFHRGDTKLGGFPAFFLRTYYTLTNIGISFPVEVTQIFCVRGGRLYLVHFEAPTPVAPVTLREFEAMLATFNFR